MLRLCLLFLWIFANIECFAKELLTQRDVNPVMQQIFEQHVDQKEMDSKVIKNAFRVYIDKFDPDRIYLLDTEVSPYLQMSEARVNAILAEYRQNRFPAFEQLNQVVQDAIMRSRSIRRDLEKKLPPLFADHSDVGAGKDEDWNDPDLKLHFAKSKEALQARIRKHLIQFINAEKQRFGVPDIMEHQAQTVTIFENNLVSKENEYLYRDEHGVALAKSEQENLFVMHVLKALASSLDAHTTFYTDSEAADLKTRLEKEFQGVGIIFKQKGEANIVVSDLSDGGPAAKSGLIKVNDILVAVEGKKIDGESFEKVMDSIRDNTGDSLSLTLKHAGGGVPFTVSLKKAEIAVQGERVDASYKAIDGGIIGVIALHSFYQGANGVTSENDMLKTLAGFREKGNLKGLILDLRDNNGGFLGQAVKVAGLFITNGVIVISKYFNGEEHYYRDMDGKAYYDGPLVVLTSRATASAAEIVAQALQDYGVALVVGDETTYGKGTIQNQNVTGPNAKGSSLFKVTVGKYYTVSGKTPQIQGVKADIVVPGIYNFEHLGEQYLEFTVPSDTIQPEFSDDLADVAPNLKAWYQRYYLPSLQRRTQYWEAMLPTLRVNSANRLKQNSDYQNFLERARSGHPTNFITKDKKGNSKPVDFQLNEGIEIVKEMIQMQLENRTKRIVNDAKKPIAEKVNFSYD